MQEQLTELQRRRAMAQELGGEAAVAKQHKEGRLTVRERIDALVDPGSFQEIGCLTGNSTYESGKLTSFTPASYVGGLAEIDGRPVAIGGEDFTVRGGSSSGLTRRKGGQGGFIEDLSYNYDIPLINLAHGAGGSVKTLLSGGHASLPGKDGLERSIQLLGRVPVISAVLGPSAGGPAGRAVLSHWSVMPEKSASAMIAGPKIVKRALGETVNRENFGAAEMAVDQGGTVHDRFPDEIACLKALRRYLSYMPQNVHELTPKLACEQDTVALVPELRDILPERRSRAYSMKRLVELVVDSDSIFEIRATYGKAVHCFLARIGGISVGIIANNPMVSGGAMDAKAASKYANFVDVCDTFHLPLLFFVDSPGFMVGLAAERAGALRIGMQCAMAVYQATTPTISIIIRKSYGLGGGISQNKRGLDLKIAWPTAEWGSLPREGGVAVAFHTEIENAADPATREREIEEEFRAMASPFRTAEAFGIEDIIDPAETRAYLARYVRLMRDAAGRRTGQKKRWGVRP